MFDYGNARVRAMKSALLSSSQLDVLSEARTLPHLLTELTRTSYRKAAEATAARAVGMNGIALLLRVELAETLGKVRSFYQDTALEQILLIFRRYDIHNLKVILHGLAQNISREEIDLAMMPVGELKPSLLAELASVVEPRAAIDLLATLHLDIAKPLLEIRAKHPGAAIWEMELALERWYFRTAKSHPAARGPLADYLDIEADILNLMTILRFAHVPAEGEHLHETGIKSLSELLVESGRLKETQLLQSGAESTVEDALITYEDSNYAKPLADGLSAYKLSNNLSEIERAIMRFKVQLLASYIIRDSLGIGVPVGYIALKNNEINNIRSIAWGVYLGQPVETIKQSLEIIT